VLLFNCTHEREPGALLAPLAQVHAADAPFHTVCFTPNLAGVRGLGGDQTDTSVNLAATASLQDQERMREVWAGLLPPPAPPAATHVLPSVSAAVDVALGLAATSARPVEVVCTGSLLLGGVMAAVLRERFHVDLVQHA